MLLTEKEKTQAVNDVQQLITSSEITASIHRVMLGEKLFGSDDKRYSEIGAIPVEIVETPPEDISGKIDATVSILPGEDVKAEDRLQIDSIIYRVQTVEQAHFFGVTTHKTIKLVRIYGS